MRSTGCDVVVIGSSNIDMTVRCRELPLPGQTILGDDFVITPGGKGANQAVAAAKLGARTQLIARLGNDVFAEASMNSFSRAGLGTDYIVRDETSPSGVALIFVDENGENQIVVAPGANGKLTPADIDRALPVIENAKVMVLQLEIPMETVRHAAQLATQHKTRVILNPAPARVLPPSLLEQVDILIANETEVLVLTGADDVDTSTAARACGPLLEAGVESVITTLGKNGAVITSGVGATKVPGFKVKAIDTTSAGDTFAGAIACALAQGRSLEDAVHFANAAAALSATKQGAQVSMPTRAEVEKMIESQ
ncbi:MAG: ribokinase [Abditibacteriota bacterium]|nr:ribokinase [Abditibacteriota bacterium]